IIQPIGRMIQGSGRAGNGNKPLYSFPCTGLRPASGSPLPGRTSGRERGPVRSTGTEMKLYDGGRAPNPRRTRIFLAEKGIKLPIETIDLSAMQHKSSDYAAVNPLMRVPALVLDNGTVITESIAICRYFEALHPDPPLFGRGALEIARIEMWNRRMELHFL